MRNEELRSKVTRSPDKPKEIPDSSRGTKLNSPAVIKLAAFFAASIAAGCSNPESTNPQPEPPKSPEKASVSAQSNLSCTPTPECPNLISIPHEYELGEERWRRIEPSTGKEFKVCEPVKLDYCTDGKTPEKDGCTPPVCENAKACDPIPSTPKFGIQRLPNRAGKLNLYETERQSHIFAHPVIFDNIPDCKPGDPTPNAEGQTYSPCDIIPTCPKEKQIKYCDPMPRCEEGQSPLKCESLGDSYIVGKDICEDMVRHDVYALSDYGYYLTQLTSGNTCKPLINERGETVYDKPVISIVCLPTPECKPGEEPKNVTKTTTVNCEGWGTFKAKNTHAISCDPIPSCKNKDTKEAPEP